MTTQLDLSQLALERPAAGVQSSSPRRTPWLTRFLLPVAILLGFVGLLGWAVKDQFVPRKPVTVVPVVVRRAEVQQAGTPLFQAPGWVEPRPTALHVPALTAGIVKELAVVEGDTVVAGQVIARLIDEDAKLKLREAEAQQQFREAELLSAQAELRAAQKRKDQPLHLTAVLAEAESQLAATAAELGQIPFLIQTQESQVKFARQNLAGKQQAIGAIAQRTIQKAETELAGEQFALEELMNRKSLLTGQMTALKKKAQAAADQLEQLVEETRQFQVAEAKLKEIQASCLQADIQVEMAKLELKRVDVRCPTGGRVMQLVALPGSRVSGISAGTGENSNSTVITLYDPAMLQVRADVRLEDVPLVQSGQPVEIETASANQKLKGVVLKATSSANVQKNTLEVKVAITDPPPTIRPEMLVTTTFLAPPSNKSEQESQESEYLLVPRELVETGEGGSTVWIVDASDLARRRTVELGPAGTAELVEIKTGLSPTDKLISSGRESLEDGDRVIVTGEDRSLGLAAR